jgi:hypothetical protein
VPTNALPSKDNASGQKCVAFVATHAVPVCTARNAMVLAPADDR